MGVYIKGMEMPKDCTKCIFFLERYDEDGEWLAPICVPTQLLFEGGCALHRASYCPLVEVEAPHGRLIDADAFADELVEGWYVSDEEEWKRIMDIIYEHILPMLNATQTIVEGSDE